ncbi:MAG: hypothetical protein R3321_15610 [Nitrososphaeraceae archaeon]|nr:hypothetical protein [Nitrososphaeraceae archaeon]
MVDLESNIGLISGIRMFRAARVPSYFSVSLSKEYKILSIVLSLFIIIHGLYHITEYLGKEILADSLLSPLSILILIVFGILLFVNVNKKKDMIKT